MSERARKFLLAWLARMPDPDDNTILDEGLNAGEVFNQCIEDAARVGISFAELEEAALTIIGPDEFFIAY